MCAFSVDNFIFSYHVYFHCKQPSGSLLCCKGVVSWDEYLFSFINMNHYDPFPACAFKYLLCQRRKSGVSASLWKATLRSCIILCRGEWDLHGRGWPKVRLRSNDLRIFSRRWRMNTASCNLYPVFLDLSHPLISEWNYLICRDCCKWYYLKIIKHS